jgi:hypothetical protein
MSRRSTFLAAIIALSVVIAGCQLKTGQPVYDNFVTVDSNAFVLHGVDRFDDTSGSATNSAIVVVKATYTNPESNPESITPSKFELLDPNLMAVYFGIAGGNIDIPSMQDTQLAPGKSVEITIGFRVPAALTTARLAYRP